MRLAISTDNLFCRQSSVKPSHWLYFKMSPAAGANEKESNLARLLGSGTSAFPGFLAQVACAPTARPIYSADRNPRIMMLTAQSQALLVLPSWPFSTLYATDEPNWTAPPIDCRLLTLTQGRHHRQAFDEQPDQGTSVMHTDAFLFPPPSRNQS